jgi:DNA-binding transcriptional LysR family regulator
MELRQLRAFAAVARLGSFTAAADELYVTQSALSQQVAKLERELGVALLHRNPKGAQVTAA